MLKMRLPAHDLEVVKSLHKISNRRLGWSSAQQIVVTEDCSNFRGCRIVCQFLELRMGSTINLPNCTLPVCNFSWKRMKKSTGEDRLWTRPAFPTLTTNSFQTSTETLSASAELVLGANTNHDWKYCITGR